MTPLREEALSALALEKPAAGLATWPDRECAGDAALRNRVEDLLATHDQPSSFLPNGQRFAAGSSGKEAS